MGRRGSHGHCKLPVYERAPHTYFSIVSRFPYARCSASVKSLTWSASVSQSSSAIPNAGRALSTPARPWSVNARESRAALFTDVWGRREVGPGERFKRGRGRGHVAHECAPPALQPATARRGRTRRREPEPAAIVGRDLHHRRCHRGRRQGQLAARSARRRCRRLRSYSEAHQSIAIQTFESSPAITPGSRIPQGCARRSANLV
jgi:hypothetical protein